MRDFREPVSDFAARRSRQTARCEECDPGAKSDLEAFAPSVRKKWPSQGRRPTRSPQRAAMRLPRVGVPVSRKHPAARGLGDRRFRTPGSWPSFDANRAPISGGFRRISRNILARSDLCRSLRWRGGQWAGKVSCQNHACVANCCSVAHTTRAVTVNGTPGVALRSAVATRPAARGSRCALGSSKPALLRIGNRVRKAKLVVELVAGVTDCRPARFLRLKTGRPAAFLGLRRVSDSTRGAVGVRHARDAGGRWPCGCSQWPVSRRLRPGSRTCRRSRSRRRPGRRRGRQIAAGSRRQPSP